MIQNHDTRWRCTACFNPRGKSGKEQRLEGSFIGGHLQSEGNLQELLKLQAQNDPDMMQWLQHSTKFSSHKCVEEMQILFSLSKFNAANIKERSKLFLVVVDGTQDVKG